MATTHALQVTKPHTPAAISGSPQDYLPDVDPKAVEQALLIGDISQMTDAQRIAYYVATCRSLGLNALTKPFQALKTDDGKVILYPDKGCAEQLRKLHRVSVHVLGREVLDDLYIVTVRATTPDGREEESQGIVPIAKAKGTWEDYEYRGEKKRRFKAALDTQGQEIMVRLSATERATAMMKCECVPLHSEILTREGWKTYDQARIGEEVLAYDVGTDACHWTPLLNITVHDGLPMARLFSPKGIFDVACTPEHSWAIQHASNRRAELVQANRLKPSHHIVLAAALQDSDVSLLQPVEAAILGWAVTDGTITRVGNSVRIGICQSKEQHFESIRNLVGAAAPATKEFVSPARPRTFPTGRTYDTTPQHWWYLPSALSRLILQRAQFQTVEDLPRLVTRLDHAARQAMLQAMMMAEAAQAHRFANTSRAIMDAFQILCTLEGYALGQETPRPQVMTQVQKQARFCAARFLNLAVGNVAPAWCPTTGYGTWVMRQNGRVLITGNTKAKRRVTLAICGLGLPDQDCDEDGAAHPMTLALHAAAVPAEQVKTRDQHIADLYGDAPATPAACSQTPPPTDPTQAAVQALNALHTQHGRNEDWIRRYWPKMAKRFQVAMSVQLTPDQLQGLYQEAAAYYAQQAAQEAPGSTHVSRDAPDATPGADIPTGQPEAAGVGTDAWRGMLAGLLGDLQDSTLAREAQSVLEDADATEAHGTEMVSRVLAALESQDAYEPDVLPLEE